MIPRKIFRTLNCATLVWPDDIILVTKEDKERHRKKLAKILQKLQEPITEQVRKNLNFGWDTKEPSTE